MSKSKHIDIRDKDVTSDIAMQKVISAQAKIKELQRKVKALEKDRNGLLEEFTDSQKARPVLKSPVKPRPVVTSDLLRVYCGDLHGMRMDIGAVHAFLSDLKTLDPDEIVLGGDMLECGGHLARHQPIGFVALCDYTYQEDIKATNWFLDELQKAAPHARIMYMEGNHEHRVERWCVDQAMSNGRDAEFLRKVYGPQTLLRLNERGIEFYSMGEIHCHGLQRGWIKLGEMFVAHNPFGMSGGGENAAAKGAARTAGNLTYFHTHKWDASSRVFPSIGLIAAFSPGCLSEMQPIWKHTEPSGWNQGYDIDFVTSSGTFQRVHVPIWRGESLAGTMIERFKR